MPRQVNIVLPSGRVVSVDEETAALANSGGITRTESEREGVTRNVGETAKTWAEDTGVAGSLGAAGYGFFDTLLLGAPSALAAAGGGFDAKSKALLEEHSGARLAGDAAALIAPTGWLGNSMKAATEAAPLFRATGAIERTLGKGTLKALAAEGAVYGATSYVAQSALSGDQLTIEGALQSMGVGAVINYGLGKITNAIFGKTAEALKLEAEKTAAADAQAAFEAAKTANKQALSDARSAATLTKAENTKAISDASQEVDLLTKEAKSTAKEFNDVLNSAPVTYSDLIATQKATREATIKAQKDAQKQFDETLFSSTSEAKKWDAAKYKYDKQLAEFEDAVQTHKSTVLALHSSNEAVEGFTRSYEELTRRLVPLKKKLLEKGFPASAAEAELDAIRSKLERAAKAFGRGDAPLAVKEMNKAFQGIKQYAPRSTPPSGMIVEPTLEHPGKFLGGQRPVIPDPATRPQLIANNVPDLPKTLGDLAALDEKTVARIANSIEDGSPLHDALNRFVDDIGLVPGKTAAETLAGAHGALKDLTSLKELTAGEAPSLLTAIKQLDDLNAKAAADSLAATQRIQGLVAASPTAPAAFVPPATTRPSGLFGVLAHVAGRLGPAGAAQAAVTGTLLTARASLANSLHDFFLKFGQRVASISEGISPLATYMGTSVLTGKPDGKGDIRELAMRRMEELRQVQGMVNDASFSTFQSMNGMESDVGYKLHAGVVGTIAYLNQMAPKDPGTTMTMGKSHWKPTYAEAFRYASIVEAALQPMTALKRLIAGQGTQEAADTLWTLSPATMQRVSESLLANIDSMQNLTREQTSALSRVFRVPLNGFQLPDTIMSLQSTFLPVPAQGSSTPPSKMPTGGAPGRPAVYSGFSNPNQSRVQQLQR